MSNRHDVIIWDADVYGTPKSFEEACSMSVLLEDKAESQTNLKIQSFLNKLETVAKSMAAEREVFESYQHISKTIDTTAAYVLEMPDDDWEIFLQQVVEIAWQEKLIVYYESLLTVFISPQKILPQSKKKIWNTIIDYNSLNIEPETAKSFFKKIIPIINLKMEKYGFYIKNKKDNSYIKNTILGHQIIDFVCEKRNDEIKVYFHVRVIINMVSDIYKTSYFKKEIASDLLFSSGGIVREDLDFSTKEGVKEFFEEKEKVLNALSFMENNIEDINKLLEEDDYEFFMSYFYKERITSAPFFLIAAHLANSPKINDVLIKFSKARIKTINPEDLSTLVNDLKNDINPHSFMSLYETLLEQRKAIDKNKAEFLMTMLPLQQEEELELLKTAWYDESTGLIWQIGCIGEQVCNENPTGVADLLTWQEVLELLKQPKYKNWRLPTKEELLAVEITQNIMYIANNQISSYGLITDVFIYHWTSNIKQLHDFEYYKKVAPILGDILSRQYANGYIRIMSLDSDEYEELMKLFHVTAEEHDVNFSRFCSEKHRITSDMAFLPRALTEKAAVRLVRDTNKVETTMNTAEVKDIPATIKKYLNQVVDEDMEQWGQLDWDAEYTFKFWLIKDDDQLINFLRSGLGIAICNMLDENEEAWQETNKNSENDDESMLRERQLFAKYPPIYAAVHDIFEFFAAFSFHGLSVIKSWSEEGMQNVLQAFQLLGLEKLATAYKAGRENIRAFKTVMEFDISQQHLEVAEAVRKNYQLFLV